MRWVTNHLKLIDIVLMIKLVISIPQYRSNYPKDLLTVNKYIKK